MNKKQAIKIINQIRSGKRIIDRDFYPKIGEEASHKAIGMIRHFIWEWNMVLF